MTRYNPLKILGLASYASKKEIRNAFLSKAKIYHPDSKSGDSEKFKELVKAYNDLQSKDSKPSHQNYDENDLYN